MSLKVDTYEFKMSVEVFDIPALYKRAFEVAREGGETEQSARDLLGTGETEDDIDVGACLQMLFDPGISAEGVEIQYSSAELTDSRGGEDDDEHQPDEAQEWHDFDRDC